MGRQRRGGTQILLRHTTGLGEGASVTSSELYDEADAAGYDADNAAMSTGEALDPMLDVLAGLAAAGTAGAGPALEFASGTGRVALPLAARGVRVVGIELSPHMTARLRAKPGGANIEVVEADMATATAPDAGSYAVVFLVYNTLSNLLTQDEQVECFRNAARHLRPGGRFVVELWVPQLHRLAPGLDVAPMSFDDGHLVFDTYDLATQQCVSHHYRPTGGGQARYGRGFFRYAWPTECDLMARLAGLELESRWADWHRAPFVSGSAGHVSVWRKP